MLLVFFHSFILTGYARFFEVSNAEKEADAIICLSGGKLTRVPESIRLWSEGYGRELFLTEEKSSNAKFSHLDVSNLDFAKAVSSEIKKNINWKILPSQDGGATSTFDEAADALTMPKKMTGKGSSLSQTIFIPAGHSVLLKKFLKIVEFKCRWQGWTMIFLMPRTGGNLIVES